MHWGLQSELRAWGNWAMCWAIVVSVLHVPGTVQVQTHRVAQDPGHTLALSCLLPRNSGRGQSGTGQVFSTWLWGYLPTTLPVFMVQ